MNIHNNEHDDSFGEKLGGASASSSFYEKDLSSSSLHGGLGRGAPMMDNFLNDPELMMMSSQ